MTAQASINTDDVATLFYRDVMKHTLLSREEEMALFRRYLKMSTIESAKDRIHSLARSSSLSSRRPADSPGP